MRNIFRRSVALASALATLLAVGLPAQAAIAPKIYYGGVVSAPNPYPWMTALLNPDLSNGYDAQFCGGSLIADDVVITAAHCVDTSSPSDVQVAVGYLILSEIPYGERQDVIEIIVHPDWDDETSENDIALLILEDGSVNSSVEKIDLVAADDFIGEGEDVRATGWGQTESLPYTDSLRWVDMEIAADPGDACQSYGGAYDPVSMICATGLSGSNIKDTCYGDSGGPLFTTAGGNYNLVGLTSWGYDCGLENYPGIYTRLTTYLDWIAEESGAVLSVANFTPRSGAPGSTVAILGTMLDTVTSVTFNGTEADFTIESADRIEAIVPTGATSGLIRVSDGTTTVDGPRAFTVAYPSPKPSKVTPSSGTFGTVVTITGKGFLGATSVKFGGVTATSFTVNSDTSITATAPEGAATGSITVTNPAKSGSGSKFTVTVPAGYPTVSKFSPSSGSPGDSITLTGTNFTGTTAVSFNGVAAISFTVVSATSLRAVVPAGATTGLVQVTNALGTNSSTKSFTVKYSTPSVSSFSPGTASAGDTVTITGRNFTGVTSVKFNGVEASSFTVVSATSITAVVPAGASTGKITVANPAKSATSKGSLSIVG